MLSFGLMTRLWYDWHVQNHHLIVHANVLSMLEEHNYGVDAQKNSLNDAVILNTTHTRIFIYPMKMK